MATATIERPWARWYGLQRWRNRAALQMKVEPLCRMCLKVSKVTPATVADHIVNHNGNAFSFWYGELQSLCKQHHSSQKARLDRGIDVEDYNIITKDYVNDIGEDGWPLDALHPVNRRPGAAPKISRPHQNPSSAN
jgi:5-methylcytosine-specific restriction protein A